MDELIVDGRSADDMVDTQIKTEYVSPVFSDKSAITHEPINYAHSSVANNLSSRCVIFSSICSGGDRFAANTLGTFKHAWL